MPIVSLSVLAVLLHLFVGLRLVPALAAFGPAGWLLGGLLAVSVTAMSLAFWHHQSGEARRRAGRAGPLVQWLGLVVMGWFSSLFLLTLARDLLGVLFWLVQALGAWTLVDAQAEAWTQGSALAVLALATGVTGVGFVNARRTAAVREVRVPLEGLPAPLRGFTIVQLSDIHVGPTIRRRYLRRIVERVNRLDADLVAITGDLVDGSVPELREHIAPLADLQARHGVFVVTGNHEYYAGAHAWIDELRRLGLRVLLNEHVLLQTRNVQGAQTDEEVLESCLVLAGVTDFSAGHFDPAHASDPRRALQDAPPLVHTRVLLAHQPRSAAGAAEAGFQLQLSGHTHGGQFFPWNLFVPMQQPFTAGLHRLRQMWIYVSRGTGYWGPPKRFGAPSEITRIVLQPAGAT